MKRFSTITSIVDTGLITSTVITGEISIAALASGVGLPVGIGLSGTSLFLSLATIITCKSTRTFTVKQEKHGSTKLFSQSKLVSITNTIWSQAKQDGEISSADFYKVPQELENYRQLKAEIRNQTTTKVKEIIKGQREELLEQGRKDGKEDFLRKIAGTSGTQGASTI